MPDLNPEQVARQQIDAQLVACGWLVQDYRAVDFSAGRGIAIREVPLTTGPCDYLLLVDRKAIGVIEAKKGWHNTLHRRRPIRPIRIQPSGFPCRRSHRAAPVPL